MGGGDRKEDRMNTEEYFKDARTFFDDKMYLNFSKSRFLQIISQFYPLKLLFGLFCVKCVCVHVQLQ